MHPAVQMRGLGDQAGEDQTGPPPSRATWRGWAAGAIGLGRGIAFGIDATHQITLAFGVRYIPLVCL